MIPYLTEKKVLFITTKNLDYIRNTQELALIRSQAESLKIIGSSRKSYLLRLLYVYAVLLGTRAASFDTVFIGFAPQLILPLFRHKFRKNKLIEDFFISLYDTLCCDRKRFKPDSFTGRWLHRLDERTLSAADLIICDTKAHGAFFAEEFHCDASRLHTLYLEADTAIYHPMAAARPEALRDKYVVLYFGSVLPLQGVDIVLGAMDLLKNHSNLYFYFIGPIQDSSLLHGRPLSENITYINWLSQEELARHISYADLCLAGHFNASIEKAKRTIPGKAYIYRAMNKPMILGDNPANHELFEVSDKNITFVEMGSAKALAEAILVQLSAVNDAAAVH